MHFRFYFEGCCQRLKLHFLCLLRDVCHLCLFVSPAPPCSHLCSPAAPGCTQVFSGLFLFLLLFLKFSVVLLIVNINPLCLQPENPRVVGGAPTEEDEMPSEAAPKNRTYHFVVFHQHHVVGAQSSDEDDAGHAFETVDPLLPLRPLAAHVKHPA